MKNNNYIISGILAVAVIVLFILQFTGRKGDTKYSETVGIVRDSTGFRLPIAYIRTDSLLVKYKFSIDLNNDMLKKVEDNRLNIKQREDKLKKDYADFQQKAQNNIFITQERAQQEYNRLEGQRQDLENYATQVNQDLAMEQSRLNQQLFDTITANLKIFNTPKKYEIIFSNVGTDNILCADDSYDITSDVIEFFNARYVPAKK